MPTFKSDPSDKTRLSPRWATVNDLLTSAMVWWRFVLIGATALIITTDHSGPAAHRALMTWGTISLAYSMAAFWVSIAFVRFYSQRAARLARILIDVAMITAVLALDPVALQFLWVFYAMRVLAALRYFDGYEWWLIFAASIVGIVAATWRLESLNSNTGVAIVAKVALLTVMTGALHYLQRLIPRLSNADHVAESALQLLRGLDREQIYEQVGRLVREGIPLADSVVIHMLGGDDENTLIPVFGLGIDITTLGRSSMRLGQGITGWALEKRTVVNSGDLRKEAGRQGPSQASPALVSLLVAPMYMGEKQIGTISANSWRRRAFDDRDEQFIQTAASQAALALTNNRLWEARRRYKYQLSDILNASLAINPLQDLDRLLDQLAEAVCQHSGYRMAAVNLIDGEAGLLRIVATAGIPVPVRDRLKARPVPLAKVIPLLDEKYRVSKSYFVRHDRMPEGLNLDAYAYTPDLAEARYGEWHKDDILLVPIMEQSGEVFGYLSVDDPEDRELPSFEAVQILEVLARLIGSMAHTAQLYKKLHDQGAEREAIARRLHLLTRIGTVAPTMSSLERVLHVHLTAITSEDGLRINRASLFRLEPDERTLTGIMAVGQLSDRAAHDIWERMVRTNASIDDYLADVQAGAPLEWTELHERIRGMRIEITDDLTDALCLVAQTKSPVIVHESSDLVLPAQLAALTGATTPVAIIPLVVGNRLLGLLICDNEFTREKLTNRDLLLNFAAHMAGMMENDRLSKQARDFAAGTGWQQGAYEERQQVHDRLHDLVGELQTRVRWDIEEASELIEDAGRPQAEERLEDALTIVDQAAASLKEIVEEVRPPDFSHSDLLDLLRYHAPRLRSDQITIDGRLDVALPATIENELYLAGREGLTNAAKYSGAKSDPNIRIGLKLEQPDERTVRLSVHDNGVGFPVEQLGNGGRGLSRLKQRVERAGGRCSISSDPTGTTLIVDFVLSREEKSYSQLSR